VGYGLGFPRNQRLYGVNFLALFLIPTRRTIRNFFHADGANNCICVAEALGSHPVSANVTNSCDSGRRIYNGFRNLRFTP
jgi:hypothetical protein